MIVKITLFLSSFLEMRIAWCLVLFCAVAYTHAQQIDRTVATGSVRKGLIYKKQWALGGAIHSNGFYVSYHRGKSAKYDRVHLLHLDIGYLDHPKATRVTMPYGQNLRSINSFSYGKANVLINARFGRSHIWYFSEKARQRGLAVGMRGQAGLNLGLLKPYYLNIVRSQDGITRVEAVKYTEANRDIFLSVHSEADSAPFWKGLGEIKIIPGFHGRWSITLDPGAYEAWVKALDIGIQLDIFLKRPFILIEENNPFFYPNFYVALEFGRRSR